MALYENYGFPGRYIMRSELSKRLETEISGISVIDPHTHLQHRTPSAEFIGSIFGYHYIKMELSTAGMDVEKLMDESLPPDAQIKNALPFIPRIRNTTTWWGFMTICRALGFEDPTIHDGNWQDLCRVASDTMQAEDWYRKALDSINIKRSFLTNLPDEDMEGCDMEAFVPSLRTDEWVLEIHEEATRRKLEKLTKSPIGSLKEMKVSIHEMAERFVGLGAASMAISLPPGFQTFLVAEADAEGIYGKVLQKKRLTDDELARLQSYMLYSLFEVCDAVDLPFQLMLGVDRKIHLRLGWDGFSTDLGMMKTFRDALNRFPNVKMIFSILNTILTHELAIYAKTFANCYAAGHWWYTFYPCIIKPMILERLQAVPYTKLIGWYSDSYYVEWTIAKIKLYIRTLAGALAEIVEDGYMDEELALEVARALLWDNNVKIFALKL
jgi:glucuronate isomerase